MAVADPRREDCPLVYVNQGFSALTGYEVREVLGHNCRFLQGPDTDRDQVARFGRELRETGITHGCLLNYRRDGTAFQNLMFIQPILPDVPGTLLLACQFDFTTWMTRRAGDAPPDPEPRGAETQRRGSTPRQIMWATLQMRAEGLFQTIRAAALIRRAGADGGH